MNSKPLVTANLSHVSTPLILPTDVYKFIVKNASSLQRSKLMEVGKFFYPKKFVKIHSATVLQNVIRCYKKEKNGTRKDITAELNQSLWIAEQLSFIESNDAVVRSLPKSAFWSVSHLQILWQLMSYENFKLLTSSGGVQHMYMMHAQIQYNDNKEVPLENIFEMLPQCHYLIFHNSTHSIVSLEAANIHCPSNLYHLSMLELDEQFDFRTFSTFMISHQDILYWITFKNGIPETYAKELESIIMKINQEWKKQNGLPDIQFL